MARRREIPSKAIQLTARAGFITRNIFSTFLYPNRTARSQLRAWSRLLDSGYFVRHSDPRMSDVFILNKGIRHITQEIDGIIVRPPYTGVIRHDETALKGILIIEDHGFLDSWRVESEFKILGRDTIKLESQGTTNKFPDAILDFKAPVHRIRVAIEIELTLKDRRRYQRILNSYSFAEGLDLILFVCASETIKSAISEIAQSHFLPPKGLEIGFMDKADWLVDPILGTVKLKNRNSTLGTWVDEKENEQIRQA